jgi:hypothetical protein
MAVYPQGILEEPPTAERLWLRFSEFVRLLPFGCGLLFVPPAFQGVGQAAMSFGIIGIIDDRLPVALDCVRDLSFLQQRVA